MWCSSTASVTAWACWARSAGIAGAADRSPSAPAATPSLAIVQHANRAARQFRRRSVTIRPPSFLGWMCDGPIASFSMYGRAPAIKGAGCGYSVETHAEETRIKSWRAVGWALPTRLSCVALPETLVRPPERARAQPIESPTPRGSRRRDSECRRGPPRAFPPVAPPHLAAPVLAPEPFVQRREIGGHRAGREPLAGRLAQDGVPVPCRPQREDPAEE